MQYKKEQIMQSIIKSAKDEFFKNGYNAAKINEIAKNAGIAVGNLYNYFASKELLFCECVQNAYTDIPNIIKGWISDSHGTQQEQMQNLSNALGDLFEKYDKELVILMDKSEGSCYQDFSQILNKLIFSYIKQSIFKSEGDDLLCMFVSGAVVQTAMQILLKGDKAMYKQDINDALMQGFSALDI